MREGLKASAYATTVIATMTAIALFILGEFPESEAAAMIRLDGKRVVLHAAIIGGSLLVWAAILFPVMWLSEKVNARCWFGHKKKWVAVCDRKTLCLLHVNATWHLDNPFQVARWVCDRRGCRSMGEKCLGETRFGVWTVQHGELVCDEKKWANP